MEQRKCDIECWGEVERAVREVRAGGMVLIRDDEERENEADLCVAAQFVTPEVVNFLVHEACGLLCVALAGERLDVLGIPLAESEGRVLQGTAFTASVDAYRGTTTGISARDRAITIRALIDLESRREDLVRPGHVFPLRARSGGVLERRGHTEAAVDLMRIAGLEPGAAICEVLDSTGEAARGQGLEDLAEAWKVCFISVEAIARYQGGHYVGRTGQEVLLENEVGFGL